MLEERLSHTYSQHNIGGYAANKGRQASSMYPSISSNAPSAPSAPNVAESFYTGNALPAQDNYSYNQRSYSQYPPQGGPPQSTPVPYAPQRTSSHQGYNPQPQQQNPNPSAADPSYAPVSPITNGTASFYQSGPPQPPEAVYPMQPPPADASARPTQPSPEAYHTAQPMQPQMQVQPPASYYQNSAQQYPDQPPPQWASPTTLQQISHAQPQQQAFAPQTTTGAYSQEAFPAAPQHQPQQKLVEESLIEL